MVELTDEEIISKVQEGDAHAFGFIVERYEGKMEARMKEHLQDLVDEGVITQEQADKRAEITKNGRGFKKGFRHGFGHRFK